MEVQTSTKQAETQEIRESIREYNNSKNDTTLKKFLNRKVAVGKMKRER